MDNRYSEDELIKFMDWLGEKGIINAVTARSRRIAAVRVLGALDDHEKIDLRQLDRNHVFHRFSNKSGKDFTPDSLATYKSRFNSALDDFLRWVDNPAGFKAGGKLKITKIKKESQEPNNKGLKGNSDQNQVPHALKPRENTIVFPIPIRDGVVVQLHQLPLDLTSAEAERICAVVKALAIPNGKG